MNRKHWFLALAAALLLVLFCGAAALAADDPLTVSMALETNKFTEPKEITVSISVTNVGESDLPGPVTLYYPSGKQVDEFGTPPSASATASPGPANGRSPRRSWTRGASPSKSATPFTMTKGSWFTRPRISPRPSSIPAARRS